MIFSKIAGVFQEVFPALVRGHGEGVAALVLRVAGVALEPVEGDAVPAINGIEPKPKVHVLLLRETSALPGFQPAFIYGLDYVGRVAPDVDLRVRPFDGLEALDDSEEFHAVVCGEAVSGGDFLPEAGADEDDAVPARAGISAGGPVGVQEYGRSFLLHGYAKIALSGQ